MTAATAGAGRSRKLDRPASAEDDAWAALLAAQARPVGLGKWQLAVVLAADATEATIGLSSGAAGRIPLEELKWARPELPDQHVGAPPRSAADVLARGDVIAVEPVERAADGKRLSRGDLRAAPDPGIERRHRRASIRTPAACWR